MIDILHPKAAEAFDAEGEKLATRLTKQPFAEEAPDRFPTKRPIVGQLDERNIVGEVRAADVDVFGRKVARYYRARTHRFGLFGDDHDALRSLADKVLKKPPFRGSLGRDFVEDTIFDWCRLRCSDPAAPSLSSYLLTKHAESVENFTVWVPVTHLEIEEEFDLGPVRFVTIPQSLFKEMEALIRSRSADCANETVPKLTELQHDLQGQAAAVINIQAEPRLAEQIALETANAAIALLRRFSIASLSPWLSCPISPQGADIMRKFMLLRFTHGRIPIISSGLRDQALLVWRLSSAELNDMRERGLDAVGQLVVKDGLNPYALRVRASLLSCSRGLTTNDVSERLIATLSALEALLIRENSEPIQQNLGERMAFLLERDPERRRQVVSTVRKVYEIRSRYVHHLASYKDDKELEAFVIDTDRVLRVAVAHLDKFCEVHELIDAIERVKFGGGD